MVSPRIDTASFLILLKGIFNTDFYHIILLFVNLHSDFGTYMNANTFTQKERKHLDDLLKKL